MGRPFPDRAAFSAAVAEHQRGIFFHVLRLCRGDEQLARDVTQRTFLKAWTGRDGFRGDASVKTWLYRIAHNLALNELRRAHRRREVGQDDEPLASVPPSAPGDIDEARQRAALRSAVEELSPRQRDVTLLRLYQDLSFVEIGEILGISSNSAKVNYHHATRNLERRLARGGAA